ncbi:MAG: DUF11 domain-containing protein, partial [Acidobacteria bacterium]|nr:DUF11 domain-containing protein [Acidobacteriota bacterium]
MRNPIHKILTTLCLCLLLSDHSFAPLLSGKRSAALGPLSTALKNQPRQVSPALNSMRAEANQPAAPQQQSAEDPEGGSTLIGRRITGVIDSKSDADVFQFHGVQGETVRIAANATFGGLDPAVTLSYDSEHVAPVALGPIAAGVCVCDNFTKTSGNLSKAGDSTTEVAAFARSDVFASVGKGVTRRYSPEGTLLQTLDSGTGSLETTGMAFDSAGNLYVTQFQNNSVFKFDINGNRIGRFGEGYSFPESIVIDLAQNIYVSNAGANRLFKFNAAGTLLDTYTLEIEDRGVDWIDLAADQRTMFYTSEGKQIKRYDVASKTQLPDFNTTPLPGRQAFALRLLPGGGLIVADSQSVLRLDAGGNVVQSYDAPGEDFWFAVNLDSDGRSFWSGNILTGKVYRFDIQSGAVLTSWDSKPLQTLAGLAVVGEITAAQVLNISKSAPPVAVTGEALTYTITFGNSGGVNATNVLIKDTVPAGTTFLSASDGGTLSGGVVTWNIGTLQAGVTGRTVSFTVRVNASSGSIVNNNYTIEATGIPPIAGPPATSVFPPKKVLIHDDNSGPGSNALIRVVQLPATGTYSVLVASSNSDSSGGYELLISPVDKNSNLSALALTPTGAPGDITVKTHSTRDVGKLISSVTAPSGMVVNFSGFSPDGSAVAVATGPALGAGSTTISVLSSREGRVVFQETAPSGFVVTFLGFSPEGEAAAVAISPAGGPPTTIKVYSTRLTGELI